MSNYRDAVGIMIINPKKKLFLAYRAWTQTSKYHWQMPQGGIDKGEKPIQAVYREMREEIGLSHEDVRFMAMTRKWYKYDLPESVRRKKSIRGQRQKWFLFLMVAPDSKIDFTAFGIQEFVDFKWVDLDQVKDSVITFKQPVYEQVVEEFRPFVERLKTA